MKVPMRVAGPIAAIVAVAGVIALLFWPHFVALFASDPCSGSIAIKDVSKAETLRLGGNLGLGDTFRMSIRVTGHLDGTAGISNPITDNTLTTICGPVDLEWTGDFYTTSAEIRYVPQDVRSGNLTVEYSFYLAPSSSPSN